MKSHSLRRTQVAGTQKLAGIDSTRVSALARSDPHASASCKSSYFDRQRKTACASESGVATAGVSAVGPAVCRLNVIKRTKQDVKHGGTSRTIASNAGTLG